MNLSRDTIINLGSNLPPSLGVFGRLQKLLQDVDTDLCEIVELIHIDPALTFQVIRMANSAAFGLKNRCDSLDEAVARVGFGDIHRLVGLAVTRQVYQGELTSYKIPAGRLWENSVAGAAIVSALAEAAGSDAKSAYTTGLMRNIGKVVLNRYPGALKYPGEEVAPDVHRWEQDNFGMSSADVSAMLLEHWRFSPESIAAVCNHFSPLAPAAFVSASSRLHLACGIVVEWGCALPGESTCWKNDEAMYERAGLEGIELTGALEDAKADFQKFAQLEWSHAA